MEININKAIIPVAGLGTRFLPLSKVVPKELWPLVEKPLIQYAIEEAKASGISQIIFVVNGGKKGIVDFFKRSIRLEKTLKDRKNENALGELRKLEELCENLSFSYVFQKKPLGDGHAILQAKKLLLEEEPFLVIFPDDVVESKIPSILQLYQVFKTTQKPVIALSRVSKEKIPSYGIVNGEKIANRLYKIKKIMEKPSIEEAPSNLAIVGRQILTSEVFDYLKKLSPNKKGEIQLSAALDLMIKEGKLVYGQEIEGKWLECGNKFDWLKSNLYLSLKHKELGPKLKKFINEEKLL